MRNVLAPLPGWRSPHVGSAIVLGALVGLVFAAAVLFALGTLAATLTNWNLMGSDVTGAAVKWMYWTWQTATRPGYVRSVGDSTQWIVWWQSSLAVAVLAGGGAGVWLGWAMCRRPRDIQVRGRRYLAGREAVRAAQREMRSTYRYAGGPGVRIHPDVALPLHNEGLGLLLTGSPGGGKTTTTLQLLSEILARGDRAIILDVKGDMTQYLYAPAQGRYLMSPGDRRTLAWDVAADVRNKPEAARWVSRLIDPSHDPLWSNAARMIATGLVVAEQVTKRDKWTLADLMNATELPYPEFRERILHYYPEATQLLTPEPTRTTQSVLLNFVAYLPFLYMLGDAFSETGHGGPVARFSMRRWLTQPQSWEARHVRVLIVQFDVRVEELSYAVIQMMVSALAGLVASAELPESKDRPLWLVFDEFSQLKKKIDDFLRIPELGRSKGLRWALSMQDISQLQEIYGPSITKTLTSMARYYVVCRTQGVETPDWLAKLVGDREVRRPAVSLGREGQTLSWHNVREPVITTEEFARLGQHKSGVDALLLTGGENAYRLTWPIQDWPRSAPASIPAPWTDPGFDGHQARAQVRAEAQAATESPFQGIMPVAEAAREAAVEDVSFESAGHAAEVHVPSRPDASEAGVAGAGTEAARPEPRLKLRATDKTTALLREIRGSAGESGSEESSS